MTIFEYDPFKSEANAVKHGIDFVEAQALWDDDRLLFVQSSRGPERRHVAIGKIGRTFWTAAFTLRNRRVRLISVRRSRTTEIALYEND